MNSNELDQRVALVCGGSGAIGAAIVRGLEQHGARCVVADTQRAEGPSRWIETDVRDDVAVATTIDSISTTEGRLDVLVYAAGITRDAVIWKLSPEDWDAVLAINLRGAYSTLRHAVPLMRRGDGGSIVLVGSINGARGKFGLSAYAASKAGLTALAKCTAREVARFGIRVNVVEPGMTHSPMTEALTADVRQQAVDETLLGRLADPDDVSDAVTFLCGPRSGHITGQTLRVDGGQYI